MKRDIGLILRSSLENLVERENDVDYYVFDYLKNNHNVRDIRKKRDVLSNDLVFFQHFPFSRAKANEFAEVENQAPFVNKPSSVLETSPKTSDYELFREYMPESIMSYESSEDLHNFLRNKEKVVVKPEDGTGGKNIDMITSEEFQKLEHVLENLPEDERYLIQEYVPNKGDKRMLVYDGNILGGFERYNENAEVNNVSAGGEWDYTNLTKNEKSIARDISQELREKDVYLIGIDLVEEQLMEVNTAAPGGIYEIHQDKKNTYSRFEEITQDIIRRWRNN